MDVEVYEGSSTHDNHMFLWAILVQVFWKATLYYWNLQVSNIHMTSDNVVTSFVLLCGSDPNIHLEKD